jgi:hypothetical protein
VEYQAGHASMALCEKNTQEKRYWIEIAGNASCAALDCFANGNTKSAPLGHTLTTQRLITSSLWLAEERIPNGTFKHVALGAMPAKAQGKKVSCG